MVSPPITGGTNWYSPAYNPDTGLFYVTSFDGEQIFFKRDEDYEEGERYTGGGGRYDTLSRALGASNAVPALGFAYNLDALVAVGAK